MISGPKAQKIWMIAGLTVHVLVIAGMDLVQLLFQFLMNIPDKTEFLNDSPVGDRAAAGEVSAAGGTSTDSYWAMVQDRLNDFVGGRMEIPIMFFMGIGLFLVGAHLYRAGIFDERGRKLRLWIMALAFGVGVPVDWACRLLVPDYTGAITRYITSTLVAFGILAAVAAFYARKTDTGILGTALSAVGKMALTCYILQNLVASIIFYDWGFGVANRIAGDNTVWWTMVIYLGIAGFLIGLSLVWLRFFKRGPVEWLWHGMFDGISAVLDRRQQRIQSR